MSYPKKCDFCGSILTFEYICDKTKHPQYECGSYYQGIRTSACYKIEKLNNIITHYRYLINGTKELQEEAISYLKYYGERFNE
jgi:hypothetical protein